MRNLERGAALRAVVENEQLPISILKMDVDSDESVDAATSAIGARTGCIDVLVNNAGIEPFPTKRGMSRRQDFGLDPGSKRQPSAVASSATRGSA